MKPSFLCRLTILAAVLLFQIAGYAQFFDAIPCDSVFIDDDAPKASSGGAFKPSSHDTSAYFRILIVYAKFNDVNDSVENWHRDSLPRYAYDLVDSVKKTSYKQHSLSDYFRRMSNGTFDFIGDVFPNVVKLPRDTLYEVANGWVMDTLNNHISSFKRYDNWKLNNGSFEFCAGNADRYLDMVIVIYRGGPKLYLPGGVAWLQTDFVTHDTITIDGGCWSLGSGITTNLNNRAYSSFKLTRHLAHEFGHYLFGWGHTAVSGIMPGDPYDYYGTTYAMSAWEREKLGYINIPEAGDNQQETLRDYVTTGEAAKIKISDSEYFLVENHQRTNYFDQIIQGGALQGALDPNATLGKGIYIWYYEDANDYPPKVWALTADGAWDWKFLKEDTLIDFNSPPPLAPWLDRDTPWVYLPQVVNKNGSGEKGHCDRNPYLRYYSTTTKYNHKWFDINPLTKKWWIRCNVMGDEGDAFNVGANEVLSPWSNPSTTKLVNGSPSLTNISVRLLSQSGDSITVIVYKTYQHALIPPPAKPQKLTAAYNSLKQVTLNWYPNKEPNLMSYRIYKALGGTTEPASFTYLATVSDTATSYTDKEVYISADTNQRVYYKIKAENENDYLSVYSDYDWVSCLPCTISANTTFSGTYHVADSLVVPSGKTLTISAGSKLIMEPWVGIKVYGKLTALGTASNKITFECSDTADYWGELCFSGSATDSSVIDSAMIKRCLEVQYLNNGSDITTIKNSVLENCWSGIYLYESQPSILANEIRNPVDNGIYGQASGLTPYIYDNSIKKDTTLETYHQGLGIYLINGVYALVAHNDVFGFDNGMYFGGNASVWFDKESSAPFSINNRVRKTNVGICAGWGTTLTGGADSVSGRNSIHSNAYYDVHAYQESWLMANWNYWGGDSTGVAYCDSTSSIEMEYPLFTDPWLGYSRPAVNPGGTAITALQKGGPGRFEYIKTGKSLEKEGRINEAIAHYKKMVKDGIAGEYALTSLAKLMNKYNRAELLPYIAAVPGAASNAPLADHARKLLGGLAVQRGDYSAASGYFDDIVAAATSDYTVIGAKFDKFFAALHGKRDRNAAASVLAELKTLEIEESEQITRLAIAERMLNGGRSSQRSAAKQTGKNASLPTPGSYELYQNYPNPFNPVTSITYALPVDGIAVLKIYDILGNEIRTVVNEEKTAGRYTVSFNASSLPSGTYFYELVSGSYRAVKKLVVLK